MKWIGLTGGIATGKSTVTKLLREAGYVVVDADELAKLCLQPDRPGLKQVVQYFGESFLNPDGSLDRKKLGARVFSNQNEKEVLEKIVHPFVQNEVVKAKTAAATKGDKVAFYDVPLLFEKNLENQFDSIILVAATEQTQLTRMKARDGFDLSQARLRLQNQVAMADKRKKADFILQNDGDLISLKTQLAAVLKRVTA